jgi:hypothetical protein
MVARIARVSSAFASATVCGTMVRNQPCRNPVPVLNLTARIRYSICRRSPAGCGANAAEAVSIGQAVPPKMGR